MSGAPMKVRAFVADLPDMSPEQLAQLHAWCTKKFEKFDVQIRDEGFAMVALCKEGDEGKSIRQWQSLIRTHLQNWSVDLPTTSQKGWLRALSAHDWRETIGENNGVAWNSPQGGEKGETWESGEKESPEARAYTPTAAQDSQVTPVPPVAKETGLGFGRLSRLRLPDNLLYNGGERFLHSRPPVAVR